jgi:hypothetical protein
VSGEGAEVRVGTGFGDGEFDFFGLTGLKELRVSEDIVGLGEVSFFEGGGVGHHGHGGLGDGAIFTGFADNDVMGLGSAGGSIGKLDDDGLACFDGETGQGLAIGVGVEELEFVGIDDDDLGFILCEGVSDERNGSEGERGEECLFEHDSIDFLVFVNGSRYLD